MAVIQGARLRAVALPADNTAIRPRATALGAGAAAVRPRASAPPTARTTPRVRPAGLFMAAIIAATMFGLVYLTQTLGSNAASSEIRGLISKSEQLAIQLQNQSLAVEQYSDPEQIIQRANEQGLVPLVADVVILTVP